MEKIIDLYKRKDKRGTFVEYSNHEVGWNCVNGGFMKKGAVMGNHYHKRTVAVFFIMLGKAEVFANAKWPDEEFDYLKLKSGEGVMFMPREPHAIRFLEDSTFLLLKSRKYNKDDKDIYKAKIWPPKQLK